MIVSDDTRAIDAELNVNEDMPCAWCNGSGWIDNPADPGDVVPCDMCAPAELCEHCRIAPAVTMAGETLLCDDCDRRHGLRIAREFALTYQPMDDLADIVF